MSADQQPKKVSGQPPIQTPPAGQEPPKQTPPEEQVPPAGQKPPVPASSNTSEGYVVPKGEDGIFHVEMQPAGDAFDPRTGKKKFNTYVQKFHPRDFALQISTNDRNEPVYATVGNRINKFLHIPNEEALKGVLVNTVVDKKVVKVPIAQAIEAIKGIIAKQDEPAQK